MKDALRHGAAAYLLSLGLTLALLACLGMLSQGWMAGALLSGITAVMTLASVRKLGRIITGCAVAVGVAAWLALGGLSTLAEILRAITLHFTGLNGAMPMVEGQTAMLITVVVGVASFMLTYRSMGAYPALAVTLLAALVLWLGDQPRMLPWLAPAVAGVMIHAAVSSHEGLMLRRLLPMAAVITALAFLLTPADGVTIQPLKDAADKLRDQIYARFMFTQPRNVFSLASEGFYPQGPTQLGGPVEPTDHPVMLVKTPRRTYLRGVVKNEYTGRLWLDTTAGRRYLWASSRWGSQRVAAFDMNLPQGALGEDSGLTAHQTVSVKMLDGSASSLFVPQRIRSLSPGGDLVPYFNSGSEVFVTRDLQKNDTYTVKAPIMHAGDAGLSTLIRACQATADPAYAQILHDYTALPEHLQELIFQIAQEATEDAQSPYDKAFALQTYLSRAYTYTLDVAPQPENIDFVSNFLLNTKEGYCTYFASAMTVLCRMVGLPARYVEGYLAEPDENGHAYVTGLNAHAWTEVYFEGFGWLTFDATPAQNRSAEMPEEMQAEIDQPQEQPPDEPEPSPEPENAPPAEQLPEEQPENDAEKDQDPPVLTWLWWLLLLCAAAAAAARIILTQPERCARRARDEMGRWQAWMQALSDSLRVLKLPRDASESPMAYAKRLDSLRRLPVQLLPVGECVSLIFYGNLEPEPEETAMTRQAAQRIMTVLNPWQKLRFTLMRAFVPAKKRLFTR